MISLHVVLHAVLQADFIKDDELYNLLTSRVPAGAAFTAIVDACHSACCVQWSGHHADVG